VPDHRPEQACAQPMMSLQQLVGPGRLSARHSRTVRSPVHEATTGVLPATGAYVQPILKVLGGPSRRATLTASAAPRPRSQPDRWADRQVIAADPRS
jgi:hypothetical protein